VLALASFGHEDFVDLSEQTARGAAGIRAAPTGSDLGLAANLLAARPKRWSKACDIVAPLGPLSALV